MDIKTIHPAIEGLKLVIETIATITKNILKSLFLIYFNTPISIKDIGLLHV